MSHKEAEEYWRGDKCYCGGAKPADSSFCFTCLAKTSPQSQLDLAFLDGKEWMQAVAAAELEILAYDVRAKVNLAV